MFNEYMAQFIAYSIGVFLLVIILLVIILLVAKKYLSPSGNVNIEINGDRTINVPQGNNLMRYSTQRSLTSLVRKSRTTGASVVSAR